MKTTAKICSLLLLSSLFTGCMAFYFPEAGVDCPTTHTSSKNNNPDPEPDGNKINLKTKTSNTVKKASDSDNKVFLSYRIGMAANMPINEKLEFETGLHLAGKGNKIENTTIENKLNLTYIDAPLVVRYKVGDSKFSMYGGLQPSVLLNAKRKLKINGIENTQKVTDAYKTFDLAASLGAGYQFDNGIRLNLGYDYGFTNIRDFDSFKTYNRILRFSVGYQLNKK